MDSADLITARGGQWRWVTGTRQGSLFELTRRTASGGMARAFSGERRAGRPRGHRARATRLQLAGHAGVEATTKSKLASLNEKLGILERKLEVLE
ncbi:hypothetical protein ABZP36_033322, partial [Zizania latifolia]